jgi:hypothetical protein
MAAGMMGDDLAPMINSKEVVEDKGVPLRM